MQSKTLTLAAAIALGLASSSALAQQSYWQNDTAAYQDWARVISANPRYEQVSVPNQRCREEIVYENAQSDRSYGGAIIGGALGGLAGSRFGKGNGRTAATAVGAVVGALTGDHIGNNDAYAGQPQARRVSRCQDTTTWRNQITGYDVTYEYNGRRYTSFMNQHPGNRMAVEVSVTPR